MSTSWNAGLCNAWRCPDGPAGTVSGFSSVHSLRLEQDSLALTSMARDDPPASSTAATMRGNVGSEFET